VLVRPERTCMGQQRKENELQSDGNVPEVLTVDEAARLISKARVVLEGD